MLDQRQVIDIITSARLQIEEVLGTLHTLPGTSSPGPSPRSDLADRRHTWSLLAHSLPSLSVGVKAAYEITLSAGRQYGGRSARSLIEDMTSRVARHHTTEANHSAEQNYWQDQGDEDWE